MIAGLSGSLLSHDALEHLLRDNEGHLLQPSPSSSGLRTWHAGVRSELGPSAGARSVFDRIADPLVRALGFTAVPVAGGAGLVDAVLQADGMSVAVLVVSPWGHSQQALWRHAVHRSLAHGTRWALTINGPAVRLVDGDRPHSRRYAEFDIARALDRTSDSEILTAVLGAQALLPSPAGAAVERLIAFCERHRTEVRRSLREGVHDALLAFVSAFRAASSRRVHDTLLDESLIVIYRVLFLLFAEARSLVPTWLPIYRN